MSRRIARSWTIGCLVLTMGALGVVLSSWPAGAAATGRDPGAAWGVTTASVVGDVEVRHPGGTWEPLAPGTRLSRGAEVRTGAFSEGVLRDPGGSIFSITPNTTFTIGDTIGEGDMDVSKFTLGSGKVAAEIPRQRNRRYEFRAAEGDAVADTTFGEFSLVSDSDGLLGVVTRKGVVGLAANGKRVEVGAGQQAVALPGAAPTDPLPIPKEVLLQVQWPGKNTTRRKVALEGSAAPGTRLRLEGRLLSVRSDGTFVAELELKPGNNQFVVVAEDLAGRTTKVDSPVIVRTLKKPTLQVETDGGNIWE